MLKCWILESLVAVLEKIKLIIDSERFVNVKNPFGEKSQDYVCAGTYEFDAGNIYGIVSEHGGGGEAISLLMSGESTLKNEQIIVDNRIIHSMADLGWYMGKRIYTQSIIKREYSMKKALELAIKQYHRFGNIDDIVKKFDLSPNKLNYSFSNNCEWEMWRVSLALGYACKKKIFCFPWMNTLEFYDCMYNSSVFRFFKLLKKEGIIMILPTSRVENVEGVVDNIIKIHNPRFEHIISDSKYFKDYF